MRCSFTVALSSVRRIDCGLSRQMRNFKRRLTLFLDVCCAPENYFGSSILVEARNNTIVVDGWVKLAANARIGALVQGLRQKMDEFLTIKVDKPSTPADQRLMDLVVRLLITDGLG